MVGFIRILLIIAIALSLLLARSVQKNAANAAAVSVAFVVAICYLGPVYILYLGDVYKHVDIAASSVVVSSVMVAVITAFLINLTGSLRWPGVGLVVPVVIWFAVGIGAFWGRSAEQNAGIAHLCTGLLAWLVGSSCSSLLQGDPEARERTAKFLTGVLAVQAVVVVGQIVGLDVNPMSAEQSSLLEGRYNGLLSHPGLLANSTLVVFTLILALRDSSTSWRSGRMATTFALVIGICIAAESRAQILGAFLLLTVWSFLTYGQRAPRGKRFGALGIAVVGLIMSYPVLLRRFEEDPTGGSRGILQDVGWQAMLDHPLIGVGPNSYVSVIGLSDALTASGVPVHNAFLLSAAELGIAGAVALWLPVLWTFVRGFRLRKQTGVVGTSAVASVAFFIPFMLSAFTGWGMLADPLWALVMVMMGAIYGLMAPAGVATQTVNPAVRHPVAVVGKPRRRVGLP